MMRNRQFLATSWQQGEETLQRWTPRSSLRYTTYVYTVAGEENMAKIDFYHLISVYDVYPHNLVYDVHSHWLERQWCSG